MARTRADCGFDASALVAAAPSWHNCSSSPAGGHRCSIPPAFHTDRRPRCGPRANTARTCATPSRTPSTSASAGRSSNTSPSSAGGTGRGGGHQRALHNSQEPATVRGSARRGTLRHSLHGSTPFPTTDGPWRDPPGHRAVHRLGPRPVRPARGPTPPRRCPSERRGRLSRTFERPLPKRLSGDVRPASGATRRSSSPRRHRATG